MSSDWTVLVCGIVLLAPQAVALPADALPSGANDGGSAMAPVPAGEFWMGCSEGDSACEEDEKPGRRVYLDAFEIDRTEVTQAAYAACVEQKKCTPPKGHWDPRGKPQHPVTDVSWAQAVAYCTAVGKRLPTEAEWEKAARGIDGRVYPWGGDAPSCRRTIMYGCEMTLGGLPVTLSAKPVGSAKEDVSPYGVLDMAGNVQEFIADWYGDAYYKDAPSRNPPGPARGKARGVKGGGWVLSKADSLRASKRDRFLAEGPGGALWGFRCARSVEPTRVSRHHKPTSEIRTSTSL